MKKALKIIVPIVAVIVLLILFYFIFLVPRFELKKKIDEVMPNILYKADYFTEYDVIDTSFVTVDSYVSSVAIVGADIETTADEYFTADIPASMEYRSIDEGPLTIRGPYDPSHHYKNSDEETVCFDYRPDTALVNGWRLTDDWAAKICDIPIDDLKEGFETLGYGNPFTDYGCWKCITSIDKDDYSFWNIKSDYALYVSAYRSSLVNELCHIHMCDFEYIYEKDNVCGILRINKIDNYLDEDITMYAACFDVFDASSADTEYKCSIYIHMQTLKDLYAIINSVEIIKNT
ncbi:MAG: hypothetical protein IJC04_03370 [Oscillospiraceae bacterium]|nr:hypothetical protein [Oscillospiraceae bacterium]